MEIIPVWELISEVGARCGPLPPGCAYLIRFWVQSLSIKRIRLSLIIRLWLSVYHLYTYEYSEALVFHFMSESKNLQ